MKLVTWVRDGGAPGGELGLWHGDAVLDVAALWTELRGGPPPEPLRSTLAWLSAGEDARASLARVVEELPPEQLRPFLRPGARLLAPLPRPLSIRDCMAFDQHLLQATRGGAELLYPPLGRLDGWLARLFGRGLIGVPRLFYEMPVYYKGNPASVVGPGAEVIWPSYSQRLDYELEFGIFIGREGRNIPASRAREYIGGYTLFNDFSARDAQLKEMKLKLGPAKGKDFDTGNAMGPWLVTPDELPDPYALDMTATVDGEVWTRSRSDGMSHSFEEIIAWISRDETLYPGDFIGAGTVAGGCGLENGRWLRPGQTISLSGTGLGTLTNTLRAPSPSAL